MEVKGTVTMGEVTTEFLLTDEGSFMQWGGTHEQLGPRVDLLEKLGLAYLEWRQENLCRTPDCDNVIGDGGDGWDGWCADCADRADCPADCSPDDDELEGPCSECGTDWSSWNGEDYDEFRFNQRKEREDKNDD